MPPRAFGWTLALALLTPAHARAHAPNDALLSQWSPVAPDDCAADCDDDECLAACSAPSASDCSAPADCATSPQPLARFLGLVAADRTDEALDLYVELGGGPRDDPRTLAGFAGWLLMVAGDRAAAERRLTALAAAPDAAMEAHAWLGLLRGLDTRKCTAALRHHDLADRALTPGRALFVDIPRAVSRDARAVALLLRALTEKRCRRGDYVATLGRALSFDETLGKARTMLAESHQKRGDTAAAIAAYTAAIAADPDDAGAHVGLGALHETACRFAEALPLLERGWQLNPHDDDAAWLLCTAFTRARRLDDAVRACRAYVAANRTADDADEIHMMVNLIIVTGEAMADVVAKQDAERCP